MSSLRHFTCWEWIFLQSYQPFRLKKIHATQDSKHFAAKIYYYIKIIKSAANEQIIGICVFKIYALIVASAFEDL
jgi:hypothetical protein